MFSGPVNNALLFLVTMGMTGNDCRQCTNLHVAPKELDNDDTIQLCQMDDQLKV